jgi:hypothetical protein
MVLRDVLAPAAPPTNTSSPSLLLLLLLQVVVELVKATKLVLAAQDLQSISNGLQLLLFISRKDAEGSTTIAKHGGPVLLLGRQPGFTRRAGRLGGDMLLMSSVVVPCELRRT